MGVITQWHIDLLMSWHHSGFNVHIWEPIAADDCNALESLAHYIIRCQFSQERMTYLEESGTVIYWRSLITSGVAAGMACAEND